MIPGSLFSKASATLTNVGRKLSNDSSSIRCISVLAPDKILPKLTLGVILIVSVVSSIKVSLKTVRVTVERDSPCKILVENTGL